MILPATAFAIVITGALALTALAPLLLLAMLVRDWKNGELW